MEVGRPTIELTSTHPDPPRGVGLSRYFDAKKRTDAREADPYHFREARIHFGPLFHLPHLKSHAQTSAPCGHLRPDGQPIVGGPQ